MRKTLGLILAGMSLAGSLSCRPSPYGEHVIRNAGEHAIGAWLDGRLDPNKTEITINNLGEGNYSRQNVIGPIIVVDGERFHYVDGNGKWYNAVRSNDGSFSYAGPKYVMKVPPKHKGFISMNR